MQPQPQGRQGKPEREAKEPCQRRQGGQEGREEEGGQKGKGGQEGQGGQGGHEGKGKGNKRQDARRCGKAGLGEDWQRQVWRREGFEGCGVWRPRQDGGRTAQGSGAGSREEGGPAQANGDRERHVPRSALRHGAAEGGGHGGLCRGEGRGGPACRRTGRAGWMAPRVCWRAGLQGAEFGRDSGPAQERSVARHSGVREARSGRGCGERGS
mmetsp:Transcript_82694/g.246626  ORF Transcript_82694/g.246626 Transcript_82694/m.246626 type:complete len:211 (+) Transcript_82694:410-1042(+)